MVIRPSRRFTVILLLSHAAAAAAVSVTAMPPLARLAMILMISLSLSYYLARDVLLLLPGSWREISFENHPHPSLLPEGEGTIASSPASRITSDLAALPPGRMASGFNRGLRRGLGHVSVVVREGSGFSGQVANRTVVSPCFVMLRIRRDEHRLPVSRVIFPDALGADEFRDLCVHLKFAQ